MLKTNSNSSNGGGGGGGHNADPFFSTSNLQILFGGRSSSSNASSRSRPGTSSGEQQRSQGRQQNEDDPPPPLPPPPPSKPHVLTKERRPSLGKKSSFTKKRRASSVSSLGGWAAANNTGGETGITVVTDSAVPPALPDFALSAVAAAHAHAQNTHTQSTNSPVLPPSSSTSTTAADEYYNHYYHYHHQQAASSTSSFVFPPGAGGGGSSSNNNKMLSRAGPPSSSSAAAASMSMASTINGFGASTTSLVQLAPPPPQAVAAPPAVGQSESAILHQHIQEMANKRISTLEYLRKAHEGRVYWFNTLLFDKPDLARMPYFDARKLARRATNYLFLGLSLPAVVDLNSSTPLELLRGLNTLLGEFDAFQQLHPEGGGSSGSLSRARLPQMFRRATAPSSKGRRTSGASATVGPGAGGGGVAVGIGGVGAGGGVMSGSLANGSTDNIGYLLEPTESNGGLPEAGGGGVGGPGAATPTGAPGAGFGSGGTASVISFAPGETTGDLLPGEEYTHLLTPSLPFDPDFFETFATLCDVLIDCYARLLALVPTPRECSAPLAELFTKADARVRKIIVQAVVKEFEDSSRAGIKTEVANVGKVVLGGLM